MYTGPKWMSLKEFWFCIIKNVANSINFISSCRTDREYLGEWGEEEDPVGHHHCCCSRLSLGSMHPGRTRAGAVLQLFLPHISPGQLQQWAGEGWNEMAKEGIDYWAWKGSEGEVLTYFRDLKTVPGCFSHCAVWKEDTTAPLYTFWSLLSKTHTPVPLISTDLCLLEVILFMWPSTDL